LDEYNEESQNNQAPLHQNIASPQRSILSLYSVEPQMQSPGFNNSPHQPGRANVRRSGQLNYNEDGPFDREEHPRPMQHEQEMSRRVVGPDGKERVSQLLFKIFKDSKLTNKFSGYISWLL